MKLVRRLAQLAVASGVVAASTIAVAPAPAQAQATIVPCMEYIKIESIQIPGYVNCMLDVAGAVVAFAGQYVIHVGECVFYYDPLFSPIPQNVAPETVEFVNCVATL